MYLPIDTTSGVPIFRQIANTIRFYIASGRLRAGEKVPAVRTLCVTLGINPATVNKAYRKLEMQGWLKTRRGLGTFVSEAIPKPSLLEAEQILSPRIDELLVDAVMLGVTVRELTAILKRRAVSLNDGDSVTSSSSSAKKGTNASRN